MEHNGTPHRENDSPNYPLVSLAVHGADEDVFGQQARRHGRVRMIEALGRNHAHRGEVLRLAAGPGSVAAAMAP